ncbi:CDGSH iron-sulfur domain-containing protein [Sphingobium boeckii]|uniref:CDGSH-type Zn-finger protein/mannose-6-phosphate isomerase-like protein (Cupin superfamily) n=1 Tax=Sphingobium boeckii TaxID=1082345 RepID=A0A7W9AFL4_9SPHN|nr:CDGSH iron-sulfur domain-containing protein [Sphingobium boeckii]MBB5684773.1 CDGSH-type Zn-finger protein/mannose-6-phosphate isomerase-like protein (cupin superfamily) [Sphingobium boeckii]
MPTPIIATIKPFYQELKPGQKILWCSCGRSKRQPFCDGRSHIGTGLEPVLYQAKQDEEVLLCGCKHSGTAPFCDGTHSNLPGGYVDETEAVAAATLPAVVAPDTQGFARLDGRCYVVSPGFSVADRATDYRLRPLVTPALGAAHQSQFYLELDRGASPVFTADGDVVIWLSHGEGNAIIGGRNFPFSGGCGVHVVAGETFRLEGQNIAAYVSVCPAVETLETVDAIIDGFDESMADRLGLIDKAARSAMGPRYFQILLDDHHGLDNSALFIGHIPMSKAEMHRHLYEEALIILSGEGMIWNENARAKVCAGDVIFFPRKHIHSLQALSPEGMDVVGFIHPGTNPGINYY